MMMMMMMMMAGCVYDDVDGDNDGGQPCASWRN